MVRHKVSSNARAVGATVVEATAAIGASVGRSAIGLPANGQAAISRSFFSFAKGPKSQTDFWCTCPVGEEPVAGYVVIDYFEDTLGELDAPDVHGLVGEAGHRSLRFACLHV
jgi:hypothetical protein